MLGAFFAALTLVTPIRGFGQGELPVSPDGDPTRISVTPMSLDFPQITLRIKITASEPIDLTPGSISISEDGASVEHVSVTKALPKQFLLLMLDRSSSVEPAIGDIKRSAARFVSSLIQEARISVVSFASDFEINQDFTDRKSDLIHAIEGIRPWGGTALYDAAYLSCDQLHSTSDPRDLRTLVLFTDGRDETPALRQKMSIRSLEDVLNLATRKNIRIITVGMGTEIDEPVLKKMAAVTHGWYLFAPGGKELFDVYRKISERLKKERHFTIGYLSPNPDRAENRRNALIAVSIGDKTLTGSTTFELPPLPKGAHPLPSPTPPPSPSPVASPPPTPAASQGFQPPQIKENSGGWRSLSTVSDPADAASQTPKVTVDLPPLQ